MKADAVTKGYALLTMKQRAALVIQYLADGNELEAVRITSGLPMVSLRGVDLGYRHWADAFFHLACWWSMQYWKSTARLAGARGLSLVCADHEDPAGMERARTLAEAWEGRLLALDACLDEAGALHGLDPAAVRKIAEAERFTPLFIECPPADCLDATRAEIDAILRAGDGLPASA